MSLSPRQSQIVQRLIDGKTRKEVQSELGLAKQTVSTHLLAAQQKVGAKTVHQLIAIVSSTNTSPQ